LNLVPTFLFFLFKTKEHEGTKKKKKLKEEDAMHRDALIGIAYYNIYRLSRGLLLQYT